MVAMLGADRISCMTRDPNTALAGTHGYPFDTALELT